MNVLTARAGAHRRRKLEHLDISLNKPVEYTHITNGFDKYTFVHQPLPEIDLAEVDCSTHFFGKPLNAPLLISSMVGGVDEAGIINRNLAEAAQTLGIAMGVGSQRCALDDDILRSSFNVRTVAPDIPLCANIGGIQLNYGYGIEECRRAVDMIEADALILHLNPLQEALQSGGNTNFAGLAAKIEKICRTLPVPVIAKEVCFGISHDAARMLINAGVSAIDVAGAGGTSWSEVEKFRTAPGISHNIAAAFSSWGIPTADSVRMARMAAPGTMIIASGGMRTGIEAAKALAIGADHCGIALPLLKAAFISAEAVMDVIREMIEVLRITMFCIGAKNISELHSTHHMLKTTGGHYDSTAYPNQ